MDAEFIVAHKQDAQDRREKIAEYATNSRPSLDEYIKTQRKNMSQSQEIHLTQKRGSRSPPHAQQRLGLYNQYTEEELVNQRDSDLRTYQSKQSVPRPIVEETAKSTLMTDVSAKIDVINEESDYRSEF